MKAAQPVVVDVEETFDSVAEKLWCALPSVAKFHATFEKTPILGAESGNVGVVPQQSSVEDTSEAAAAKLDPPVTIRDAVVPVDEMQHLAGCVYTACHTNPVDADVEAAVAAILDKGDEENSVEYSWGDFREFLERVESQWMEWADMDQKWLAVTERQHIQVLKDLLESITYDVEPFGLLPRDKVLTMRSTIVHTKQLRTLFKTFVDFVSPPEYPAVYDKLWGLLIASQNGCEVAEVSPETPLELNSFTKFVLWFCLSIFVNATEAGLVVAAKTLWLRHLNERGVMLKKQFVDVCRYMCKFYSVGGSDVEYFEKCCARSEEALQGSDELPPFALFQQYMQPTEGRMLVDPNDLYIPEELERSKWMEELYRMNCSSNRIIVHGRRGVGKSHLAASLAKRLGCVHLDAGELALEAEAAAPADPLGAQLRECTDADAPISLATLAALVRKKICSSETRYRGYVFSDIPFFSSENDAEKISFFTDCGLLDELVPTTFVLVDCENEFHPERLEATLAARESDHQEELSLLKEEKEEEASYEALAQKIEELKATLSQITTKQEVEGGAEAPEGEEANAPELDPEEVEKDLKQLLEDQTVQEERKIEQADSRIARTKKYRELRLRRLVAQTLSEGYESGNEMSLTALPCFETALCRARLMGRCLTVDCASVAEEAVTYIVDTLSLQPCVRPWALVDKVERDPEREGSVFDDPDIERLTEEFATNFGVMTSSRWKRFCPVTFAEHGVLVEGSIAFGCVFRQQLFYLASEEKLSMFRANPCLYLGTLPLSREPILLLSLVEPQNDAQLSPTDMQILVRKLHEQLDLTPMAFSEFTTLWDSHRLLKGKRAEVLSNRTKYEVVERKQRADRLKKRLAQEKRKKKSQKSPGKGKGKKAKSVVEEVTVEEYKGWEKKAEAPETIATRIAKNLEERLERQNTLVPVLVHALDDNPLSGFDQLFSEKVVPRTVVVLQYEKPTKAEDSAVLEPSAAEGVEENSGEVPKVLLPQEVVLDKLSDLPDGGVDTVAEVSPHDVAIHRIVVNDKDVHALVTEIMQAVCPGMDPVGVGVVDDAVGEDDEEDAQEFDDDENEEDDVPTAVNPAIKPGKTFLNQFGTTLEFCPVTLCERRLLVRGQSDHCLQYRGYVYTFASLEAKTKFEFNPLRYMRSSYSLPPCRMWIVGQSKSGKKTLAQSLHEAYDVPYFQYNRKLFDQCVEVAMTPTGGVISNIFIPPQTFDNPYLALAAGILKEVQEFDPEQERRMKLREEAERELERREEAANNGDEEEDELDEEAEARLQEHLAFEPETEHDRQLRLSEAYLKVAGCVTHIEPFASKGYIMVCPPFSDGDIEVLSSVDAIPEVTVNMEVSDEIYFKRNKEAMSSVSYSEMSSGGIPEVREEPVVNEEAKLLRRLEYEDRRKEREVARWRRRHIGADDPESDVDEELGDEGAAGGGNDESQEDEANERPFDQDLIVEKEAVGEFAEAVEERSIPMIVLNGDLSRNAVFRRAVRRLSRFLENRRSLLHAPQIVRYEDATRMLESGEATLSCFGSTDPVTLYDLRHGSRRVCKWRPDGAYLEEEPLIEPDSSSSDAQGTAVPEGSEGKDESEDTLDSGDRKPEPPQLDTSSTEGDTESGDDEEMSELDSELLDEITEKFANRRRREWLRTCQRVALLHGRLFFFESDETLLRYMQNPLLFIQQPPPQPPLRSMPVITFYDDDGAYPPENSGPSRKRCTAEHVAFNLNWIYLSLPKLLSWSAVNASLLSLSRKAIDAVLSGSVDDALVARLLGHRLNAADAKQNGVVLHNLPRTPDQYRLLLAWGLKVDKIFQFDDNYRDVATLMKSTATIEKQLTTARVSVAGLSEICDCIDGFVVNEGRAILSHLTGFPIDIDNSYHTVADIETHLSPYRWFCPYSWCLGENLVDQEKADCRFAALYDGQYYFFSSEEYLERFLLCPSQVTLPPGFKALPTPLPVRVQPSTEYAFELEGCCPVLLYDTRENRGLRGVLEPVARKGDPSCIVEYGGCYYALLDEEAVRRFLMRPWQYVDGAKLPPSRKVPLPEGKTMSTIDEEEFIRRILYDPVAHALIAVAEVRPKYYGLSLEESALKYIALHMKCFNPKNSEIQAKQYKKKFEIFSKQSTLYKTITMHSNSITQNEKFAELCDEWENSKYGREKELSIHCGCETEPV